MMARFWALLERMWVYVRCVPLAVITIHRLTFVKLVIVLSTSTAHRSHPRVSQHGCIIIKLNEIRNILLLGLKFIRLVPISTSFKNPVSYLGLTIVSTSSYRATSFLIISSVMSAFAQ